MQRLLIIACAAGLLLVAAPAPAGAAEVGRQVERSAPARYPATLPGCRPACRRGRVIARGKVLLSRTVRLAAGERRTPVRFACPRGRRFETFGFLTAGRADVLLQIPADQIPYTRRTRVRLLAERGLTPLRRPASGTVYGLCRRPA